MTPRPERFAWPHLMRLGLQRLGLTPDVFWSLTPAELMLMAGLTEGRDGLSRSGFETLQARFPDTPRARRADLE